MLDRPYQTQAIDAILAEFGEGQSTLCVMPTGTVKTVVFAKVIQRMPEGRVMVLALSVPLVVAVRGIGA